MEAFDATGKPITARIAAGFARINTAMRAKAWQKAAESGLTPTQAEILCLIASRNAPLRLTEIAKHLAITPATASDAVTALVAKALVEKGRAPDDGRAVALRLTPSGMRQALLVPDWSAFLGEAASGMPIQEQAALLRLLVRMIRELQERGDIPANRMCVTCKHFGPNETGDPDNPHFCSLVKRSFADQHLRVDCPGQEEAGEELKKGNWEAFARMGAWRDGRFS